MQGIEFVSGVAYTPIDSRATVEGDRARRVEDQPD